MTQDPANHQLWDLRFNEIDYLPKVNVKDPQKFLYSTKIGFGITVSGIGESVATKTKDNGESTSVLKFSSESCISIIKNGSGYWKYVPCEDGIRFFTAYDYTTRWGLFGKVFDKVIFRPMMIWATAWSFDCLKNWLEKDFHPKQSVNSLLTILLSNFSLSMIWIYQGLVPKLLFQSEGELEIIKQSGFFQGYENTILLLLGILEIIFGMIILLYHNKTIHVANVVALILLGTGAIFSDPLIYTNPFNPFSLSVAMIALSLAAIFNLRVSPSASKCITKQKIK
jgi:hypothetical protein